MNALKKCIARWIASKPAIRMMALLLVVAMSILPASAGILSALPDPPTFTGAGYNTSYGVQDKVDRVELPNGGYKDLPYTEYMYAITIDADYLNEKLETTDWTKNMVKDVLKENLPATVYDMLIKRDPQAIKEMVSDYIKDKVMSYFKSETGQDGDAESDTAVAPEGDDPIETAIVVLNAAGLGIKELLDALMPGWHLVTSEEGEHSIVYDGGVIPVTKNEETRTYDFVFEGEEWSVPFDMLEPDTSASDETLAPGETSAETTGTLPKPSGTITLEQLQQIKDLADKLIGEPGEGKPFTKEEIFDIVDLDKVVDHFGLAAPKKDLLDENGDPVLDENGDKVQVLDKNTFFDELVYDTTHDEDILNSDVVLEDIAKDVVDTDKLEEIEISYSDVLRILLTEVKGEIADLVSRVTGISMGPDGVLVYTQDGSMPANSLNLSAVEQVMLSSIPTIDELIETLRSGEDVLYEMNFFVTMEKKKDAADESAEDTPPEMQYLNFVFRISLEGSQEARDDLCKYLEDAEEYFSYSYELPTVYDKDGNVLGLNGVGRYDDVDANGKPISDGTLKLNINLPTGLLNVALKVINEKNLPADIKTKLGEIANLDFSNEANHPVIIDTIIKKCSVVDLLTMLRNVKGSDINADTLEKYHLTASRVDTALDYFNRAINKLEEKGLNYGDFETRPLCEYYNTKAGTFTYVEKGMYADVVETVERLRTLPDYVKDRLCSTEIRHDVYVNINLEDIYKVTYNGVGSSSVVFLEKGSALDTTDAPYGWVVDGDETLTGITVVPASDVSLSAKRKLTYRYRYSETDEYTTFETYFTKNTLDKLETPKVDVGYDFAWDYSSVDGSRDVELTATATAVDYKKLVTYTIGDQTLTAEVVFQVNKPMVQSLNEQLKPAQKFGFTGHWYIKEAPAARMARAATTSGGWTLLDETRTPSADTVGLELEYRYTANEYEQVWVNGEWQEGLFFTLDRSIYATLKDLTAQLEQQNPGKDVVWYLASADEPTKPIGEPITETQKPVAETEQDLYLYLTYELITATHTVTFKGQDGTTLKTETVTHGGSVTIPTPPDVTGYTFKNWTLEDGTVVENTITNVTSDLTVQANYTPHTYTVIFQYDDGTKIDEQTVAHGQAATAPADPSREGYTFTGWDKEFDNITSDLTITAQFKIKTFTVTFKDHDDTVLKEETVEYGQAATAPADPSREGYTFTGWDKEFDNITSDLTVTAQFKIKTFTVTFKDHDDTVLKEETVEYGQAATAPADPSREGYTFIGWDASFDTVKGDLTITALYEPATYTVTFKGQDGTTLKTETVTHGGSATAPDAPALEGHTFKNWTLEDGTVVENFTNITSDLTVQAAYAKNIYKVKFVDDDGNIIGGIQEIEYGGAAVAPDSQLIPTYDDRVFTGWDKEFNNITSDLTVTAVYKTKTFTVTFKDHDGTVLKEETVEYDKAATAPADPSREGYTFIGWDASFDNVKEDITITALYEPIAAKYTVTFKDHDGTTLKTETVESGKSATAPADPTRTGYTFTGWDKDFSNVTADMDVTAQYKLTEYERVYINGEHQSGLTFTIEQTVLSVIASIDEQLKADNPDATIEWYYGDAEGGEPVGADDKPAADEDLKLFYQIVKETETTPVPDDKVPVKDEDGNILEEIDIAEGDNILDALQSITEQLLADNPGHDVTWYQEINGELVEVTEDTVYQSGAHLVYKLTPSETETETETESETESESETGTVPGTEPGTEPGDDDGGFPWWILLIILLLLIIIGLLLYLFLFRRKKDEEPEPDDEPQVAPASIVTEPAEEEAEDEPEAPLFIPLGEEAAEEVIPDEIEIRHEVSADVVDSLMTDKVAEHFLEMSVEAGGTGKMGIINVGQISENYEAESHVDLADLQSKGLVDDNIGRLKVLAAGILDKPLYVKADAFSVQAIKMITLTGGHAIKLGSGVIRPTEPKPDDAPLFHAHDEDEVFGETSAEDDTAEDDTVEGDTVADDIVEDDTVEDSADEN